MRSPNRTVTPSCFKVCLPVKDRAIPKHYGIPPKQGCTRAKPFTNATQTHRRTKSSILRARAAPASGLSPLCARKKAYTHTRGRTEAQSRLRAFWLFPLLSVKKAYTQTHKHTHTGELKAQSRACCVRACFPPFPRFEARKLWTTGVRSRVCAVFFRFQPRCGQKAHGQPKNTKNRHPGS